jgi:predicted alpha/beta-hydrolase family hydrolase
MRVNGTRGGSRLSRSGAVPFSEEYREGPAVRGLLHRPEKPAGDSLVLSHGAGSNCRARLLAAVAEALARAGFVVLRCDLPFRQKRLKGPPLGSAAEDREGLRRAVAAMRRLASGRAFLGGHSYGGRQASMLAAEEPGLVDGLLLLSYPLHPPKQPGQLRTAHFAHLRDPALFVHGSRDPFGSLEEMRAALALIPAPAELMPVDGAGHDLAKVDAEAIVAGFRALMQKGAPRRF